jgi:SpoVK/Ycf46/Vps4 family AAA+-type ATPase
MAEEFDELDDFNERVGGASSGGGRSRSQNFSEPCGPDDDDGLKEAKDASMWAVQGPNFFPCDEAVKTLAPGQYEVQHSQSSGYFFQKKLVNFDELMRLPDSASEEMIKNIQTFWTKEEHFRSFGFLWKRGILLWGPAGSGKTSTLQLISQNIVEMGGISVYVTHPGTCAQGLSIFRRIEPDRPCVVMLEDLDAMISNHGEHEVLALLDGELQIDNVVFIACHSPETKILTKDLRWVEAGSLQEGDELWGFDEHRNESDTARGSARRYKASRVVSSFAAQKECVRVHLDTGESFICTTDHPWLSTGANKQEGKNLEWCLAEKLLERPNLVRPFLPWEEDTSREAAWFAGLLEGEGHVCSNRDGAACGIGIVQSEGKTADKMVEIANRLGKFSHSIVSGDRTCSPKQLYKLKSTGGTNEGASIIGRVRADRLIENYDLTGKIVQRSFEAKVVAIEPVGLQEVQSIETTSGTYFAEGFAVHNTTNYPERLDKRIVNRPSRFDIVKLIGMPNAPAREMYLGRKNKRLLDRPEELAQWVKESDGFSIAHLKELIVSVEVFEVSLNHAIKRLRKMMDHPPKSTDSEISKIGQYS